MANLAGGASRLPPATESKLVHAASAGRGVGGVVVFQGPRGTGQAAAADQLAAAAGAKLLLVNVSRIESNPIDSETADLRRVFDRAGNGDWVLFFDEADALFGSRTDVKDSHDRYANQETSYLLERLEKYRGLAILATNRRGNIPARLRRRLLTVIDFPPR